MPINGFMYNLIYIVTNNRNLSRKKCTSFTTIYDIYGMCPESAGIRRVSRNSEPRSRNDKICIDRQEKRIRGNTAV